MHDELTETPQVTSVCPHRAVCQLSFNGIMEDIAFQRDIKAQSLLLISKSEHERKQVETLSVAGKV